ncbi:cupredoxin domain-containing protein [Oharaeibacter diazotrophicus]|uniref:cupredoxin domain-containing protein n=1 Tax=Oharaeibacter diazotrophicus TaxID=1920512 RepID=UPI0013F59AEA|nr:cupredoxin family copper-binding protein [Oharaeibacter diazotrophicus]
MPAAAAGPAATVTIANFTFEPAVLDVAVGTTVTWTNGDDIPHTVVETGKTFKSKPLDTDDSFSHTFESAGEFAYFCSLHPHMTGKVVVHAAD